MPGEFLLDERLQRHHESLVLGTSLKFAALASELAVDELAIRRNLKGTRAAWFASDGAALDVGLQLNLQSIEGGLVASGTTVFDVDSERHFARCFVGSSVAEGRQFAEKSREEESCWSSTGKKTPGEPNLPCKYQPRTA